MLNELQIGLNNLGEEQCLNEPPISHTSNLKRKLQEIFPEDLSFFPKGKYMLVHSADMNPCEYAIGTLHGLGVRYEPI